eukprot:TRINITY_DN96553_c0_g1_i1.p1 TRINITY_DN96553_c0_g1~~TRINITY_DN96553_c0_g1_i1.p1  ORF type:complete len:180 (+),score=30.73 TRINITY_DN96553_c0_g1_i1:86-625(+)
MSGSGSRGAGSFLYSEGHRLCVSASHGKGLTKTGLQEAFGDFGHIYQIETPKPNLAFIAFAEKGDATDAMKEMDGTVVQGQSIIVSWAGPKPSAGKPAQREMQVLTSTKFEREDLAQKRANYRDEKKPSARSRSRRRSRSKSRRSRSRRRERSRKRSTGRSRRDRSHSGRRKKRSSSGS